MSSFEPNKCHLREFLIYFFNLKKEFAAEAHRLLVEAYGDAVLSERSREWFQSLRTVNLTSKIKNVAKGRKYTKGTKTRNWKYYWMKIRAKRIKNLHLH